MIKNTTKKLAFLILAGAAFGAAASSNGVLINHSDNPWTIILHVSLNGNVYLYTDPNEDNLYCALYHYGDTCTIPANSTFYTKWTTYHDEDENSFLLKDVNSHFSSKEDAVNIYTAIKGGNFDAIRGPNDPAVSVNDWDITINSPTW